ncbi:MAG: SufE family protein [Hyphomicrobiaceae bacterium]
MSADLDTILSDFEFLDDWEDRYRYVIDLGRQMPDFPEDARTEANKVRGCASQVWLLAENKDGTLHFSGDSDAMIVSGLIAILIATYSGKTPEAIMATDIESIFTKLGLKEHLTQQRSNGFASMVQRIRADAGGTLATT